MATVENPKWLLNSSCGLSEIGDPSFLANEQVVRWKYLPDRRCSSFYNPQYGAGWGTGN